MAKAVGQRHGAGLFGLVALLAALANGGQARADNGGQAPPACWFYKYQWVYYRMVPNAAPPVSFATSGTGTGLMVTDGTPPSPAESEAIAADIRGRLPRGDAAAPPPQAFIQSISRMACPKPLDGMTVALAKVWLRQPEPPPAPPAPRR